MTVPVCEVHGAHRPASLTTAEHHVMPRGMAGPDVPENRVTVCPSGHMNIHALLRDLIHGRPMAGGARKERELAQRGYDEWVAAGKPGTPE